MESELMENDPFATINESMIEDEYKYHHVPIQEYFFIIGEFLIFLACLAAVAANIFLSIIIIRYKKLRTRLNAYILNIALLNVFNHLIGTLLFVIELLGLWRFGFISCVLHFQNTLQALHVVFSVLLATDWFLSGSKPHWITIYNAYYKIIFFAIYTFFLIEMLITFAYAELHHYVRIAVFKAVFIVCLIIMIILNILKKTATMRANNSTTQYAFVAANIFVFAYFPIWVYHTLPLFFVSKEIVIILSALPALIWIIHPIIVLVVLYVRNKYFKIAYMKLCRRSVNEYDDEINNLDEESGTNTISNNVNETNTNNKVENTDNNRSNDVRESPKISNKERINRVHQNIEEDTL